MTDYSELKRLAEDVLASDDHADFDGWAKAEDAFSNAANPAAVLALIAENDKLLKLLKRMIDQYVPLVECEGLPGYSRVVELVEVVAERDQLKAEVEALRKQVADMSPFKGAPLTGPDIRCLACGGYHYGLRNLPCPKMRAIACAATYMANQRIVPVEPMIAGPHPLDAALSKEAGQ